MVKVPRSFPHCKQTSDQIPFMLAALYRNVSVFYILIGYETLATASLSLKH